ncbi:MAG: hypothetical protein WAZ18_00470 [Alphaproteobacteria bacterium]
MNRKATLFAMVCALGVSAAVPAHAGMMEWVDDVFTFREDQKERVSPRRALPPKVVVSPYYDERQHDSWSNYYTRTDLQVQNAASGSASKVMRPATPPDGQGGYDRGFGQTRSAAYIGEPGTGPGMNLGAADARVNGDTRIGNAVRDWRDGAPSDPLGGRAGDYNYRLHAGNADDGYSGQRVYRGDGSGSIENGEGGNGWSGGKADTYTVERGDTLSGIADKPQIYDNWKLWPLIYSANRKVIGRDPDNLKPQQNLDIPRDYTDKQARAAERKAGAHGRGVYGDGR